MCKGVAQIQCKITLLSSKYNVNSKESMTTDVSYSSVTVMINT